MSYYSAKPVHLELRPSAMLARAILLSVLVSLFVLLFLPLPVSLRLLTAVLVLLAARRAYRRHAVPALPDAIVRLSLTPESGLQAMLQDGRTMQVTVCDDSLVTATVTVLNLRSVEDGRRYALLLLRDNVDADAFRRLRVWLKWGRRPEERPASG